MRIYPVLAMLTLCAFSFVQAINPFHPSLYYGQVFELEIFSRDLGVSAEESFDYVINNAAVVVDFYTQTCPPCRALAPKLKELARIHSKVIFIKVDAGRYRELAARYQVRSVPNLLYFNHGRLMGNTVGADQQAVDDAVRRHLS